MGADLKIMCKYGVYHWNTLDELVFRAGRKPLLSDFGIHHRLKVCDRYSYLRVQIRIRIRFIDFESHKLWLLKNGVLVIVSNCNLGVSEEPQHHLPFKLGNWPKDDATVGKKEYFSSGSALEASPTALVRTTPSMITYSLFQFSSIDGAKSKATALTAWMETKWAKEWDKMDKGKKEMVKADIVLKNEKFYKG